MREPDWYIKMAMVMIGGMLILGYAYFQIMRVARGATLSLQEPASGATFSKPLITVDGEANRVSFISINGRQIFTDESGRFKEEILLAEGYNVLTVAVKDRFGAVRKEMREVVYKPEEPAPES